MAQGVCGNDLTICFPSGGVTVLGQDTPVWQFRFVQLGQRIEKAFLIKLQPLNQGLAPGLDATQTQIDNLHTLALAFPGPNPDGRTVKLVYLFCKEYQFPDSIVHGGGGFCFVSIVKCDSGIAPGTQGKGQMMIHLQNIP